MILPPGLDALDPAPEGGRTQFAPDDLRRWQLPRGRHGLPPELVAQSQRERLLAAIVRVTAEKGYRASSVADILGKAGVGRETFYRHFKDKEDCFLAANDALVDHLAERVTEAYGKPGTWPQRVRHALAAMLEWLAADADVTRVMFLEIGTVGPISSTRLRDMFRRFSAPLEEGRALVEDAPDLPHLPGIAAGGVFACIYDEATMGETEKLPQLLPQLTFELLLPYIGEQAAARERKAAKAELSKRTSRDGRRAGTPR